MHNDFDPGNGSGRINRPIHLNRIARARGFGKRVWQEALNKETKCWPEVHCALCLSYLHQTHICGQVGMWVMVFTSLKKAPVMDNPLVKYIDNQ